MRVIREMGLTESERTTRPTLGSPRGRPTETGSNPKARYLAGIAEGRHPEPWVTTLQLAEHLGCSVRWLKYRAKEGMPTAIIAGRRKHKVSEVEAWLEREGWLVRTVGRNA